MPVYKTTNRDKAIAFIDALRGAGFTFERGMAEAGGKLAPLTYRTRREFREQRGTWYYCVTYADHPSAAEYLLRERELWAGRPTTCREQGCGRRVWAAGLCNTCYNRQHRRKRAATTRGATP